MEEGELNEDNRWTDATKKRKMEKEVISGNERVKKWHEWMGLQLTVLLIGS